MWQVLRTEFLVVEAQCRFPGWTGRYSKACSGEDSTIHRYPVARYHNTVDQLRVRLVLRSGRKYRAIEPGLSHFAR